MMGRKQIGTVLVYRVSDFFDGGPHTVRLGLNLFGFCWVNHMLERTKQKVFGRSHEGTDMVKST
jgi:hypothetical protein